MLNSTSGIRSRATIAGHPIHPMLVPFPIAFLVGVLACDLVFWGNRDPFWARAAFWLVSAGLATAALAAIFGLVDFLLIRAVRAIGAAWIHLALNVSLVLLTAWNLLHRIGDPVAAVLPLGLILSAAVTLLLLASGWYGGELAYRFKVGSIDGASGDDPRHAMPHAG